MKKKTPCKSGSCNINKQQNGKGDGPRNTFSKKFKENYDSINWKKKKIKRLLGL